MKFLEQSLAGVFLIEPEPFSDDRGLLRRVFCGREFAQSGVHFDVKQSSISENKLKGTLRGFHYQRPPYQEGKTLSCIRGAIYDIVADLRPASPTYSKWISMELNEENRLTLYVPPGCANCYLTLKDDTQILYYHSEFYTPGSEHGIRYDDPFFNFKWPMPPAVISVKDKSIAPFVPEKAAAR